MSGSASDEEPIPRDNYWVFGYASLMWRPGFVFEEMRPARLPGFRRDMCLLSIHYRGTKDVPGLVCGLMPGGGCDGRAYRIHPEAVDATVKYLDDRELITRIYLPLHREIVFADGARARARVYVTDTTHGQYIGGWSDREKAACIARGRGSEGRSLDYLAGIVANLRELGIEDRHMTDLLNLANAAA